MLAATWWAVRACSSRAAMMPLYQLRGVVAGAAAHDVRAVGLLGVFVVAFGDPLIQVRGVGVAARALDSTVLNDAGATQGHDHPARSVLDSASRPLPAPGVRHTRVGRRS